MCLPQDDGVVTAGCDGITAMSALNSSQQMIGQLEDGLSTLLQSTERERDYVRVAAVHALAAVISGSPANCKYVSHSLTDWDMLYDCMCLQQIPWKLWWK